MHFYNDLPWNPVHRAIQQPLQGVLDTCPSSAKGPRRNRTLLLFGFVGAQTPVAWLDSRPQLSHGVAEFFATARN